MKRKKPGLAAFLNFIFLGAGYLYNGKRKTLAWLLIVSDFLAFLIFFDQSFWESTGSDEFGVLSWLSSLGFLLFFFAFARDAYIEAEEINKSRESV
jgi:hypothetical protein